MDRSVVRLSPGGHRPFIGWRSGGVRVNLAEKEVTRLDRYLLREIAVPFCVGMGLFFVVVAFAQVLMISDSVTGLAVSGIEVFQALLYSLPPLMGLLIPVSMFFATLLGVGRLAADRELIGMAAAGVGPRRHLRMPALMAVGLALVCALTLVFGEPWGVRGIDRLFKQSAQRALASGVRPGEFNEWVPGVTFMARDRQDGELVDVVFADRREAERPVVISARRGVVVAGARARDIVFDLKDGAIVLHDEDSDLIRVLRFEKSRYRLDVARLVNKGPKTLSDMQRRPVFGEKGLWEYSRNPENKWRRRVSAAVIMHRKAALPFATLIFALLAVPLAMRSTSGARARSFLYSAAIVGVYYYLGRAFELLAREDRFPFDLAAWMPNLLALVAVAVLIVRMPRRAM
jgi:lipopolysaccharide export system permease protein